MKKVILVDVNDYTLQILKYISADEIECFLDKEKSGQSINGIPVYAQINSADIPRVIQLFDIVLCSQDAGKLRGYAANMRALDCPFMFAPEFLLERGVTAPEAFPYPFKHLADTYHVKELRLPTAEEEKFIRLWEDRYRSIILGVIHPTAIGAFSWTFGSYAEFAEANRHNNVCLAVCRGDHPLMYTVKKFYVPNEFLFTKYLATYPSINENNIIAWCVFLSRHFDRLTVFDYNSAWWTCWHQMRAFYQNKLLEHPVIAPQNRIHFTLEEEREGERLAYELGITRNYVCFFSRDSSYTDTVHDRSHLPPAPSNAGNEYRNSDINRYKYMAEKLEYRGIQSVRMGAIVNKPYEGKGVDYSTLGRSEFMDIYLFSKCFFLSMTHPV